MNSCVLGLGTFDGVHLGHRALLNCILDISNKTGLTPCVHIFTNHPLSVLSGNGPAILTTYEEKVGIMKSLGIANFINETFTREFANLSPLEFVKYIFERANARHIVVGFNYTFGKNGAGIPS